MKAVSTWVVEGYHLILVELTSLGIHSVTKWMCFCVDVQEWQKNF